MSCPDCANAHTKTFLTELAAIEQRRLADVQDGRPILDVRSELALVEHRYRQVISTLGLDPFTTSHADLIEVLELFVQSL